MLAMAFPNPKLPAQGGSIFLKFHIFAPAAVTVARFPGGIGPLMGSARVVLDLVGAVAGRYGAAHTVTDSAFT